jgi:lipopolysaccharide heptosyltransferase I
VRNSGLLSRTFARILLIKPSAVGDVVHTIPVLAKLRARYPKARIDWLLTPAIADLVGDHPALSNVVIFPRHHFSRVWRDWRAAADLGRLLQSIYRSQYDLVIDLHGQFRSAVLCLASAAPIRIGFDRPRRQLWQANRQRLPIQAYRHGWTGAREGAWLAYSHHIPIPTLDIHAVDRYLWLGNLLGFDDQPPDFRFPILQGSRDRAEELLAAYDVGNRPLALLVPGTIWETKHWHVAGFAQVARHLTHAGYTVVLAGSLKEAPRCKAVAEICPEACDLSGRTSLSALAALIQRAAICVTNDSGAMHLAVALERPVVSIFGPTDPVWVGPYGRAGAVVRAGVICSPCYLRKLHTCPHDHVCMKDVTAAQVIDRIDNLLCAAA